MNKLPLLLCGMFLALPLQAQEEPFQTVITPAFSPVTWDRLVNAESEPENEPRMSRELAENEPRTSPRMSRQ